MLRANMKPLYFPLLIVLASFVVSSCSQMVGESAPRAPTQPEKLWRVGGKIHFEEEGGSDYIGLKEINAITRSALRSVLPIAKESGDSQAKILLKDVGGDLHVEHFTEKSNPGVGEEMHATLLYTAQRGFCASETLAQVCHTLFTVCETPPDIATVSARYSAIIKPHWRFKISEILLTTSDGGSSFIMAKLLLNDRENIYLDNRAISAGLHMALINCENCLRIVDPIAMREVAMRLNEELKGKFIKIADRNGVADLEFGLSGQPWRLRAGEKIQLPK